MNYEDYEQANDIRRRRQTVDEAIEKLQVHNITIFLNSTQCDCDQVHKITTSIVWHRGTRADPAKVAMLETFLKHSPQMKSSSAFNCSAQLMNSGDLS